ncbi:MAG: phenylalanine--tRNA ligase subunit beta [Pseudomonadota bacterium]|jgi:phenylalanyl-tRNA synthetase beta chain
MQVSEQWLREWLPEAKNLSTEQLVKTLTDLGLEVDDCRRDEADSQDSIYTLKTPANRGDCLGVLGVVRELSARFDMPYVPPFKMQYPAAVKTQLDKPLAVVVDQAVEKDCPLYQAVVLKGINPVSKTPLWMAERLRKSGIRTHLPIVDILNYVMLELGQPMHAFDRHCLSGALQVRHARAGETLATLDGVTVSLTSQTVVIADEKGPQAIAGIMGGLSSSVTDRTTDVVIESAYFNPIAIRLAARAYHLRTDAAQRFERGVDPNAVGMALDRAIQLIQDITGGMVVQTLRVQSELSCPQPVHITFPVSACFDNLGVDYPLETQEALLTRLGFNVTRTNQTIWDIKVPSYRGDVTLAVDLVEELARLKGLETIRAVMPSVTLNPTTPLLALQRERQLSAWLSTRGYQEAITYSFIDPVLSKAFTKTDPTLVLLNPISSEMAVMRSSLLPGLLTTLKHHQRNIAPGGTFFEIGRCFSGESVVERVDQPKAVALVATGDMLSANWGLSKPALSYDFFALKAECQALCRCLFGNNLGLDFVTTSHPAFHPGESADILLDKQKIGVLGALHPALQAQLELQGTVYALELFDIEHIPAPQSVTFKSFSRFPTVTRDLALLVPNAVTAQQVEGVIASVVTSPWIFQQTIFDVYQGKGIPLENHKSLGIKLTFQLPDKTLVDAEVNTVITAVLDKLNKVYGIQLRQ